LKRRLFPPKGGEEYVCQAEALRSKGSSVHPSEGGKRLCCAPRTERKAPGWTGRHESAFCCSSQFKRPRNGACGCGRASDRVVQRWRCERRDVALISPVGYDLVARRKRRLASCRTEMASSFRLRHGPGLLEARRPVGYGFVARRKHRSTLCRTEMAAGDCTVTNPACWKKYFAALRELRDPVPFQDY
jgi:hypothetical protein